MKKEPVRVLTPFNAMVPRQQQQQQQHWEPQTERGYHLKFTFL